MNGNEKSLESWLWDAACSIRGAREAAKYKDFILPLVFTKRLCDIYDDEINRIATQIGSRSKAFDIVARDKKLVRFYLPFRPDDAAQHLSGPLFARSPMTSAKPSPPGCARSPRLTLSSAASSIELISMPPLMVSAISTMTASAT